MQPLHYVAYLRPRAFLACWLCAATGYAISPAKPDALFGQGLDLIWLFLVYAVFLWGGTNALNSAMDRDEGPVNLLPNPPPRPPGLAWFGLIWMGIGVALAAWKGWPAVVLGLVAVLLSIYYSVPGRWREGSEPRRWWLRRGKEIPGIDILINTLGFGLGAVLLGWSATPAPLTWQVLYVGLAFTVMGWGGIPTSQIFQLVPSPLAGEGQGGGPRNWTFLIGPRNVLLLGPVFFVTHVAMLAVYPLFERPDVFASAWRLSLWLGWFGLLLGAAAHSLVWARSPFEHAYRRMVRHMLLVLGGQACWTVALW
jgi:hypothetical protein